MPRKSEVQILPPLIAAEIERVARRMREVWVEWAKRTPCAPSERRTWDQIRESDRKLWRLHAQLLVVEWKDRNKTQEQRMVVIRSRFPQEG